MKFNTSLKKKMKSFIALTIIIFSGIAVWSCSQDEIEGNEQPLYRYSASEIATLRSMAEQYGIPNVKFITESETELASMEEMETIFKNIALIKACVSAPMEIIDSTENEIIYQTRRMPFKRLETITETLNISNNISYGTLTWSVHWTQVYDGNRYQCPSVSVGGQLSLSSEMERNGFHVGASNTSFSIRGSELYVTFTCEIMHYSSVTYVFETSRWIHPGFRAY